MTMTSIPTTGSVQTAQVGPRMNVEFITPELASEYLTKNTHNRNLRGAIVAIYAAAMMAGQWVLNGESIKFAPDGTLVDGQHRLAAIVEAGVGVHILVVRDVDIESQLTVDVGLRRSIADHLTWRGEVNSTTLGATLNAVHTYRKTGMFNVGTAAPGVRGTYRDLLDLLDAEPAIRDSVRVAKNLNAALKCPTGAMAALHYTLWCMSPEDADGFFEALTSGADLAPDNPVFVLRRAMERAQRERVHKMATKYLMAITIKAWNLWIVGDTCKVLGWRAGGAKAEAYPVPDNPNTDLADSSFTA